MLIDVIEKCYQCAYSPPKTVYEKVKHGYGHVSFFISLLKPDYLMIIRYNTLLKTDHPS